MNDMMSATGLETHHRLVALLARKTKTLAPQAVLGIPDHREVAKIRDKARKARPLKDHLPLRHHLQKVEKEAKARTQGAS